MWTRRELKEQAKFHLRGKYWMAFVVTLILGILAGEGGGSGLGSSLNLINNPGAAGRNNFGGNGSYFYDGRILEDINTFMSSALFQIIAALVIATIIFGIAYQIFVAAPIRVGAMRWFSRSRETNGTPSISQMFSLFRSGRYLGSVRGMLWKNFWLWIWSVLSSLPIIAAGIFFILGNNMIEISRRNGGFIIDLNSSSINIGFVGVFVLVMGILASTVLSIVVVIKRYSYYLVPWILADNPAIGARRALIMSKKMTSGNKFEMFVLDLSFIGWYLLGLLLCCIGVIFVTPYYTATLTELYAALRDASVNRGEVTMAELGYRKMEPAYSTVAPTMNSEYTEIAPNNEVNNDPEL